MKLVNETVYPARLLAVETPTGMSSVVIVKATYEVLPTGETAPCREPMPIIGEKLETPYGVFHTEHFMAKEGVDVCLLGTLRRARPITHAQLTLWVGEQSRALSVYGPRKWLRRGSFSSELVPGAPEPFDELVLGYTNAFGGTTEYNDEAVPWPDNPTGMGYYYTREQAIDQPLPRIESGAAKPIHAWDERPEPAGWGPYPMFWGLRARAGVEIHAESMQVKRVHPRLNNHAHPSMVFPSVPPGTRIVVDGVNDQPWQILLPRVVPHVRATIGTREVEAPGLLDGVFMWSDVARLTVTYRAYFSYPFVAGEVRSAMVYMMPAP